MFTMFSSGCVFPQLLVLHALPVAIRGIVTHWSHEGWVN